MLHLGCIVEGHGDAWAVPVLLRRIQAELAPALDLRIATPWRVGRQKLVKPGELEEAVEKVVRRLAPPRKLLILVDADVDCPKELAPSLLQRVSAARPDVPVSVVLAKHEFEAWFLAGAEGLSGHCGIPATATPCFENPESIRDAKKPLRLMMPTGRTYTEPVDQPALAAVFDMHSARVRSPSFDKLWREVERLLGDAARTEAGGAP